MLWLENLKSESTLEAYSTHLLLFCRFLNVNHDQLIQMNKFCKTKSYDIKLYHTPQKIAKKSAGKPKRGELSVNNIKLYLSGGKSFLEFNEIALQWKKISKFYSDDETNSYRSYTKEEIVKLLSVDDLRDRCIILLMASSGIRVGAIQTLKIKSLKRLDNDRHNNSIP